METQNPLQIQELIDLCITFLCGPRSWQDLLSCALVARSWVAPAQASLFHTPHVTNHRFMKIDRLALLFCETITAYPFLASYVRELNIVEYFYLQRAAIGKICSTTFPRLECLSINLSRISIWEGELSSLVTLKTLRYLQLDANEGFPVISSFVSRFTPTIEHLDLRCRQWDGILVDTSVPPIKITSLRLEVQLWNAPPQRLDIGLLYPFEISQLRALEVVDAGSLVWDSIPDRTRQTIKILQLDLKSEPIDLSRFPHLILLRVVLPEDDVSVLVRTLKTITSEHCLETLIIWTGFCEPAPEECKELDITLSSLPLDPFPKIQMESSVIRPRREQDLRDMFPKLVSQNKFIMSHFRRWNIEDGIRKVGRRFMYT
ncbi:hypothetical protein R3P38DRAFT_3175868 [Favolaschia claudopus]|uniref:F-box domain-containing protein n=1 Tax=Favolaschia claudopus TaxID=2862362 RepID=A0AAW0D2A2_9AGAR